MKVNIETSIVSELFFNFTYYYVKNKFSNYSSSGAWAKIDGFYNEVIKGSSEGKSSDKSDNSKIKAAKITTEETINKKAICDILGGGSNYKDSIIAVLSEIYDGIFNVQSGESYMENWKTRLLTFYGNNNVRDAHKDKEDRMVEVISGNGWQFQPENCLPLLLEPGVRFKIEEGEYHRLIKGIDNLQIRITKLL